MIVVRLVLHRLTMMMGLLLILSFLVFGLLALTPGSPEQVLLGTTPSTPETVANIRAAYHLDEPYLFRYWLWLQDAVQLDFGRSIRSNERVSDILLNRVGVTASLGAYAFAIVMVVGVPAGMLSASRRESGWDRAATTFGLLGISAPVFAVGILLLYVFAVLLEWFPTFGAGSGLAGTLVHLTLPAIALAAASMAMVLRQTRAAALDVMGRDFVTFARARGLPRTRVWRTYGLRNSSLPVITSAGLVLANMLSGTVLVETVFGLPGLGSLLVESVRALDIPTIQALAVLTGVIVITLNLVVDMCYLVLDPRVRYRMSQ